MIFYTWFSPFTSDLIQPAFTATGMVHALIDAAYNKEPRVQDVVSMSLCEVGKKRPNLVLSSCHSYLLKHSKVRMEQYWISSRSNWKRQDSVGRSVIKKEGK